MPTKKTNLLLFLFLFCLFTYSVAAEEVTLIACGDIMLGRRVGSDLSKKGFTFPFSKIQELTSSADITFANLECPVSDKGSRLDKKYCFRAQPKAVEGLVAAGFDVLSLANNHAIDYGKAALMDTIDRLRKNNIMPVGAASNLTAARAPAIIEKKGTRFAFLAYDCTFSIVLDLKEEQAGVAAGKIEKITEDIKKIRNKVDVIIVSFHWGVEYREIPNVFQIELAHKTINAGADIIIGHHPHVIQGIEFYKDKPILYSLGNFVFDQNFDQTPKGMVIKFTFNSKKLDKVICIPIIRNFEKYYPQVAQNKEKQELISLITQISKDIPVKSNDTNRLQFK